MNHHGFSHAGLRCYCSNLPGPMPGNAVPQERGKTWFSRRGNCLYLWQPGGKSPHWPLKAAWGCMKQILCFDTPPKAEKISRTTLRSVRESLPRESKGLWGIGLKVQTMKAGVGKKLERKSRLTSKSLKERKKGVPRQEWISYCVLIKNKNDAENRKGNIQIK